MSSIRSLFGWGFILSFALVAPVSLPAGGSSLARNVIRRSGELEPCLAGDSCDLLVSPFSESNKVRKLEIGTPMRVLRVWNAPDGGSWIQVQITSFELIEVIGLATRGWVNV